MQPAERIRLVPKLKLTLYRLHQSLGGTLGMIMGPNGIICKTMEPVWRDNKANISCIPEGVYSVKYLKSPEDFVKEELEEFEEKGGYL